MFRSARTAGKHGKHWNRPMTAAGSAVSTMHVTRFCWYSACAARCTGLPTSVRPGSPCSMTVPARSPGQHLGDSATVLVGGGGTVLSSRDGGLSFQRTILPGHLA